MCVRERNNNKVVINLEGSRGSRDIEGVWGRKENGEIYVIIFWFKKMKKGLCTKVYSKYQCFLLIEVISTYSSYLCAVWDSVHRSRVACSDAANHQFWYSKTLVNCEPPKSFGDDMGHSDVQFLHLKLTKIHLIWLD